MFQSSSRNARSHSDPRSQRLSDRMTEALSPLVRNMGFLNTKSRAATGRGLQTTSGQETRRTASRPDSHGSSDQDANSKGSRVWSDELQSSRVVNSSASHAQDPGELVAATEGMRSTVMVPCQSLGVAVVAVQVTTRRYCRCSSIYSARSPPFTGCSPLQIGTTLPHPDGTPVVLGQGNQKAAGRHGRQLGV